MDDLEKVLQRYRPPGPPPELRGRMMSAVRRPERQLGRVLRDWLPPLAAAAAIVLFSTLAANVREQIGVRTAVDDRLREAMLNDLSAALGGGDFARAEAQRLIEQNEEAARLEAERRLSVYEVFAHD